ncbi:MAG: MoxR family ATPase [Planctomycetota bacterium]
MKQHPRTVGGLKESGYVARNVKDEIRANLMARLKSGQSVFDGIIGYEDSVFPEVVNALLSRHDLLFLGLRGQAKTRMIRMLPTLLDEFTPTPAAGDVLDDPLAPRFARHRRLLDEHGDDLEIRWVHRDERFHEKLATPDVTIADLLGEIDLIKHAEGRPLDDEGVIHFGLIPRTNRGIFAINEIPDLAPKIQVGLFNALEERDVQIRGFPVRMPLDIAMAFTANPEDYTNRGRIVTPLKDRIGSVIRTHYPRNTRDAIDITRGQAWLQREDEGLRIEIPPFMLEIVEEMAFTARNSPHVNQLSGVSVRMSIANAEILVSNAQRRALVHGETKVVPRISDLAHIAAGCRGKVELMLADDDKAEDKLIASMIGEAVKQVFEEYTQFQEMEEVIDAFADRDTTVQIGDEVSTADLAAQVDAVSPLKKAAVKVCVEADVAFEQPEMLTAAAEFVLEALYVANRLSKYAYHGKTIFKR